MPPCCAFMFARCSVRVRLQYSKTFFTCSEAEGHLADSSYPPIRRRASQTCQSVSQTRQSEVSCGWVRLFDLRFPGWLIGDLAKCAGVPELIDWNRPQFTCWISKWPFCHVCPPFILPLCFLSSFSRRISFHPLSFLDSVMDQGKQGVFVTFPLHVMCFIHLCLSFFDLLSFSEISQLFSYLH